MVRAAAVHCQTVTDLLATIVTAAGVFAGTNVDDLLVLTVLFLAARAGGAPRPWQIWAGQYAGVGILVAVSALAALGLTIVPDRWVGLLGLVPFALGVRGLITAVRGRDAAPDPTVAPDAAVPSDPAAATNPAMTGDPAAAPGPAVAPDRAVASRPAGASGLFSVAAVTVANGADNLAVYTPLLRTTGLGDALVTVAVFAAGIALWCLAGARLGSHERVVAVVRRSGHWLVPGVFLAIGVVIVASSGVVQRLLG